MQSYQLNVSVLIFVLMLHLYCFSNQGHNKNILSVASSEDGSTLYTGSFDSRICILSSTMSYAFTKHVKFLESFKLHLHV